jgi:eukaryotic-like serine/threonine-protein kinase
MMPGGSRRSLRARPAQRSTVMRVIIISDSRDNMAALRRMLASVVADIEVTEHDPAQRGKPPPGFDWTLYDALFIDDRLAGAESGLGWLTMFRLTQRLPPTVVVADQPDDFVSARAEEMPHTAYLRRDQLDPAVLSRTLSELGVSLSARRPGNLANLVFNSDREVMRKLAQSDPGAGGDGYKFVRLIGQGSQSRVYLAERLDDHQTLVLKVLDLGGIDDESAVQRFAREAALLASIQSPYVIRFHDHGFTNTFGYIAVEFFARGDLKQRIQRGIAVDDALIYALNIAYGLEAIHAQGIVHRDLKPGNIMFRGDDSLALADFGISKHLDDSWDLTKTGAVIGTLSYLSPEQGLGRRIDERTDLYALGMVLFEMLTGRTAFHATSPGALVYQHLYADVPLLPDHLSRYQRIIAKLLAKDPDDRYPSAGALIEQLAPLCG